MSHTIIERATNNLNTFTVLPECIFYVKATIFWNLNYKIMISLKNHNEKINTYNGTQKLSIAQLHFLYIGKLF